MLVKNINGINHIKLTPHRINCSISFKGGEDSFVKIPRIADGNLTTQEVNEIIETINNKPVTVKGYSSNIFNIGNKKIIKALKKEKENDMFSKGQIEGEYIILKRIQEKDPSVAVNPLALIKHGNKDILVEEFISDTSLKDKKISSEIMEDLLKKFSDLDKMGIINYDLHKGNILFTAENKPKLIDFGASGILSNHGHYISSNVLPECLENLTLDNSQNFIYTFFHPTFFAHQTDNPFFNIPSNTTNFETRTLYDHLIDNIEDEPLAFFKNYLKEKAEIHHKGTKEILCSLNIDDIDTKDLPYEEIKLLKEKIAKAIKYEDLSIKALSEATDDVIKTELSKIQLKKFLNFTVSTKSPINDIFKIKSAYEQLIESIENGIKNNDGKIKEYFIETLNWIKNTFNPEIFDDNQVKIPLDEDLINIVYKKVNNIQPTGNKKIKLIFGAGAVALAGIGSIGLILSKKKKNKEKEASTQIKPSLPKTQQTPNIFKEIEN